MKKIFWMAPLIIAVLSSTVQAQVPVRGPGNVTLRQLEGSPTLVTVVLRGEREVRDPNLRIKSVLGHGIVVETATGDEHTYLFDSISAIQVQGDVVERPALRLPLVGALRTEDQQIVNRATNRVRDLFEQSTDNQELRMNAAVILRLQGESAGVEALDYLNQLAETNDLQTQLEAAQRLYLAGEEVSEQVINTGLMSGNRRVRIMAIELAGLTGYQDGTPMLMQALNDRSDELSTPAAIALARMGNREIIPRLLNLITEPSERKGTASIESLTMLGGNEVIEQMRVMLSSAQTLARFRMAQVLFRLEDPNGRRILQETIQNVPTLALEAAIHLAEVRDEPAMTYLRRRVAQRDDPTEANLMQRARMAAAMMSGNDPNAIAQFQELLRGELAVVKTAVCDLVLELGDRRLLVILQPVLESTEREVALRAAMTVAGFGYPQYRERLLALRLRP